MENLKVIIADNISNNVTVSTATNLGVNRIDDNYVIVLSPETFESMHDYISQLGASIVKMFNVNLPDKDVLMSIVVSVSKRPSNKFHETLAAFANIASNFNKFSRIQYIGCNDLNGDDDEEEEENVVDPEESADDIRNRLMEQIASEYNSSDEDDDYDEDDEDEDAASDIEDEFDFGYTNKMYPKKNKPKKPYYGTSRIWKNSDNIKRSIKRHGVVVTDSKKDVKSDEKIIKEFLKDFIPGGADWKKEFRKEVLERWMHCYAIEKKRLKKYEKKARKHSRKKRAIDPNKAVEFTKRLFYTPIDKWADPSR